MSQVRYPLVAPTLSGSLKPISQCVYNDDPSLVPLLGMFSLSLFFSCFIFSFLIFSFFIFSFPIYKKKIEIKNTGLQETLNFTSTFLDVNTCGIQKNSNFCLLLSDNYYYYFWLFLVRMWILFNIILIFKNGSWFFW